MNNSDNEFVSVNEAVAITGRNAQAIRQFIKVSLKSDPKSENIRKVKRGEGDKNVSYFVKRSLLLSYCKPITPSNSSEEILKLQEQVKVLQSVVTHCHQTIDSTINQNQMLIERIAELTRVVENNQRLQLVEQTQTKRGWFSRLGNFLLPASN